MKDGGGEEALIVEGVEEFVIVVVVLGVKVEGVVTEVLEFLMGLDEEDRRG